MILNLLIGGAVSIVLGLCLEQDDGADIAARGLLIFDSLCFQFAAHTDGVSKYIVLSLAVIDDDRQLDHICLLQLSCIHEGDDIALFLGGGR